jgi:hypothetical protein
MPFHPQPLFVSFQPLGVDVYKIKVQRTAEFRQRGAEFLKGLGVAYTFLGQQAVDVAVQIFADGLAHDLAGCLFDKRVQRVLLIAGFEIHDLTLEFLRFLLDKGFDALFVGTVTARFTLFCIPVLQSEGNVQTDVLPFSVLRQP